MQSRTLYEGDGCLLQKLPGPRRRPPDLQLVKDPSGFAGQAFPTGAQGSAMANLSGNFLTRSLANTYFNLLIFGELLAQKHWGANGHAKELFPKKACTIPLWLPHSGCSGLSRL